jgi:hypothetical protein
VMGKCAGSPLLLEVGVDAVNGTKPNARREKSVAGIMVVQRNLTAPGTRVWLPKTDALRIASHFDATPLVSRRQPLMIPRRQSFCAYHTVTLTMKRSQASSPQPGSSSCKKVKISQSGNEGIIQDGVDSDGGWTKVEKRKAKKVKKTEANLVVCVLLASHFQMR